MPKQFPSGFLVAVLLTASGLLWAVMFFGPLAYLSHLAGGASPFDIRPKGYSYLEARTFLEAIGAQGRARTHPRCALSAALRSFAWARFVVAHDAGAHTESTNTLVGALHANRGADLHGEP